MDNTPAMDNPRASRPMILIGTLQGGLLWWLWRAAGEGLWPATQPIWMGALLWGGLAAPLAYYLSENTGLGGRRRALLLLAFTAVQTLLGAYTGWMESPSGSVERALRLDSLGTFGQITAALIMGFIALSLACGWRRGRWDYQRLFRLAWRNGGLCASAAGVTALFWIVLFAGAMLMDIIGIGFIRELIAKPIFAFPVTGMIVAAAFALGHTRASMLDNLRHFWLALNSWLLPLLLAFGAMWVAALPFTGVGPLFDTRSAAFILLWFAALAVNFLNCAWQDGRAPPPYPTWLARIVGYGWLSLPVVAAIAGWALLLRVRQHGWTEDRVWAALVWLMAAGYAVGYGLSLIPRRGGRPWMATVARTNIPMALFLAAALTLLASPIGDPRRIAVASQVARLQGGAVAAEHFDYDYLRWRTGRWGTQALAMLGEGPDEAIASRARQALARQVQYPGKVADAPLLDRGEARARIELLGAAGDAAGVMDSLVDYLREGDRPWNVAACLQPRQRCAIWLEDLDNDGREEALLLTAYDTMGVTSAMVLAADDSGWRHVATVNHNLRFAQWTKAIADGEVTLQSPRWPDLIIDGKRLPILAAPDDGSGRRR